MIQESIPNYVQEKLVDENGFLTPAWSNWFQQMITYMQNNLSQEGMVTPSLTTDEITEITAQDNAATGAAGGLTPKYHGALMYDETTDQLKVNINGTIKTVTVT